MSEWFTPPGGFAQSINDDDVLLVNQQGVSRVVSCGAFLRGVKTGLGTLGTGFDIDGSGKQCGLQFRYKGLSDPDPQTGLISDVWEMKLVTIGS